MKNDKIRRFTLTEVLFHWLNAVIYLLLAITGAVMLFERLLEVQMASRPTLSVVHRIAGASLVLVLTQTFLLSLSARKFRQFWLTLGQCLSWRWADILWLLKVPLNTFFKRIMLPPVGRFNPGQKLHILAVFILLGGFCVSGLAIMLIPGALTPWIVHIVCFVPAALFLLVHMFFALVNPTTRKALPCIITGLASRDYAREHHALLLDETADVIHKSYVSWLAAALFMFAIGILLAGVLGFYGFGRFAENIDNLMAQRGANLIMPGELSASHAAEPQTSRCTSCHDNFRPVASNACLRCHERIGRVMADGIGYHGILTGQCRSCHCEHLGVEGDIRRFDTAAFNHDLARFGLDGKHRELPCDKCHLRDGAGGVHRRTQYIGLDSKTCSDCHENPHEDARAADCVKCHTLRGWKGPDLLFVHNRDSEFRLEGKHSDTPCEKCHMPQMDSGGRAKFVLSGIATDCSQCHRDPHNGQFAKSCDTCHSEQGWKGKWLADSHGPYSLYPLRGKHATVDCVKCHTLVEQGAVLAKARFAGLSKTCAHCHEDPHSGQMRSSCEVCHTEQGWTGRSLLFTHDQHTEFQIDIIHSNLPCLSCHERADTPAYRPLPKTCKECHVDLVRQQLAEGYPEMGGADPHAGRVSCTQCHNPDQQSQTLAEYASACRTCHNRHYEQLFYDWIKSLNLRESQARLVVEHLRDPNTLQAKALARKISQAKSVGFHNLALALKLWTEVSTNDSADGARVGLQSSDAADR